MSLFLSQRVGRSTYLGTRVSPLVLLWLLPIWLVAGAFTLTLRLVQAVIVSLLHHRHRHPTAAVRAEHARMLVRDAVTADIETIRNEAVPVWTVFAIGPRFIAGRPSDETRLVRLYPGEAADIVTVGFYPTAAHARNVADRMRRAPFSGDELKRIFGVRADAGWW